jgi:hypothetical protein
MEVKFSADDYVQVERINCMVHDDDDEDDNPQDT